MTVPPPTGPWLHPALTVGTSSIEGRGLFAVRTVPAETTVAVFAGRLVTNEEMVELFATSREYVDTLSIDKDSNLVLPGGSSVGFGNHSCDPNPWWGDDFSLATRRALAAGNEATLDYGTITDSADFTLTCECQARDCRGRVTGRDWRVPELQRRYARHWVPALLDYTDQPPSIKES